MERGVVVWGFKKVYEIGAERRQRTGPFRTLPDLGG